MMAHMKNDGGRQAHPPPTLSCCVIRTNPSRCAVWLARLRPATNKAANRVCGWVCALGNGRDGCILTDVT